MICPSCNKFAALEFQEPEVNDVSFDGDGVNYEVRIVRNSECCGDEMKEYVFSDTAELPDEIVEKINAIKANDPEADFDVREEGCCQYEEGGHRYKKSYYGFTLTLGVYYEGPQHKLEKLGEFEVTDNVAASDMDELV